jgi:DNA-binding transcriptional MerR regulator
MPRGRAARLIPVSSSDVVIPDKLYFRIGEVSELTRTKAFVLRFWETEFSGLRPVKGSSGHRLYRRKDVDLIFQIRHLLYEKGFTIDGARRHLATDGKHAVEQKTLFQPAVDTKQLKAIKQELQAVLTMLSRKC